MRAENIEVSEIDFLSILECKIEKKVNHHGVAKIVGLVKDNTEKELMKLACTEKYLHVVAISKTKKKCIFTGIIENMEMEIGINRIVTFYLVTGTKLLDLKNRTRTFQDESMSYKEILKSNEALNKKHGAASIFRQDADILPKRLIAQYKESDWEFAIRMASHCNTCIIPSFDTEGSKYFFGIKKEQSTEHIEKKDIMELTIRKNVSEYEKIKQKNLFPYDEQDSYVYKFKSREIFEIGKKIDIGQKKNLYVYSVLGEMEGAEYVNTYMLRTVRGFSKAKKYNDTIIGASLSGNILKVTRDKVMIRLKIDSQYEDTGEMYFPYSTVYSSPDGTGWYCMPEIGDEVRIYFPSSDESEAYVISSVHLKVSNSSPTQGQTQRTNPSHKSISNAAGKEILFTPNSLSIISPGKAQIVLDDEEGITISTEGSIRFKAKRMIEMHSEEDKIKMDAAQGLALRQGDTAEILIENDEISFKGARMHMQDTDPLA